jgi:hypothetical protein
MFTVGAGAASRYGSGSGSDQMMRLLAAPAPQHRFLDTIMVYLIFLIHLKYCLFSFLAAGL